MKPTQAQIEAAAAAMREVGDCALPMSRWEVYATAALTAEQEHFLQKTGQKPDLLPNGNAAEVGPSDSLLYKSPPEAATLREWTAAVEVGETKTCPHCGKRL